MVARHGGAHHGCWVSILNQEKPDSSADLKNGDQEELGRKGLLACLVTEELARQVRAGGSAEHREREQIRLRNSTIPSDRASFVVPEAHDGEGIHHEQADSN